MLLLDLKHSGKLCEDLIIHGSNYGFVGAWTALCCSVFAAIVSKFLTMIDLLVSSGCPIIQVHNRTCDFTAHMCTGRIIFIYKLLVNPLFKLISIEHVIIGSKTQWKTM